jgi:hypothetical protein
MSKHDDYMDPDKHGVNDEHRDNTVLKEAFPDYDSLAELYRYTYKYTSCGPSIGALIQWTEGEEFEPFPGEVDYREVEKQKWFYCDDLRQFGTWEDMDKNGQLVLELSVSSIVEGIEACTETEYVVISEDTTAESLADQFDTAVDLVNGEADDLWKQTHGCETCAKHWAGDPPDWKEWGDAPDDQPDERYVIGSTPIWDECPECGGDGAII